MIQTPRFDPAQLIPDAARIRPGVPFDPDAATRAYLATVPRRRAGAVGRLHRGRLLDSGLGLPALGDPAPAALGPASRADCATGRSGGAAARPIRTFLYYALFTARCHRAQLSIDGVHRLRPRARLWAGHPGVRRLAARSARRARRLAGAGRHRRGRAVRGAPPLPARLACARRRGDDGVPGDRRADRAGLHRAAVQSILPAR